MANTGNNQAVVAYRVRNTDGAPLDINGNPTSESGLRQAIAVLIGRPNPDPALFEVAFYYQPEAVLDGNPTTEYDPEDCLAGFIYVSPNRVVLDPDTLTAEISIISSQAWALTAVDPVIEGSFNISALTGGKGTTKLTLGINEGAPVGQGNFTFTNTATGETAKLYIIYVLTKPWVLADGTWNMLGFWYNDELFNF